MIYVPNIAMILGIAQTCSEATVLGAAHDTTSRQWPPPPIFGSGLRLVDFPANFVHSVVDCLLAAGVITILKSVCGILQAINTF